MILFFLSLLLLFKTRGNTPLSIILLLASLKCLGLIGELYLFFPKNLLGDVQIGNLVQIILNGVTKIYAGELVEEAKKIMVEEDEVKNEKDLSSNNLLGKKRYNSPIRPRHLREARRRMIERGVLPLVLNNNNKIKKNKII